MRKIPDIVCRPPEPEPWSEGDNIPWDDPEFSERMLAEHLSQDHDLASRRSETIDRHVEWIFNEILDSKPARVLDLGCGPGFYALRLARLGCDCVGIDFSPASIRYARETAALEPDVSSTYRRADVRAGDFGKGFDLVMMVYGQFNVFPRDRGKEILSNAHSALNPGGSLLLEYHDLELIRQEGTKAPSWYTAHSGLFSDTPHLVLQENFWHEEARASTTRFCVVDGTSGSVTSYALSNEAYTEADLAAALGSAGFTDLETHPSLTGVKKDGDLGFPVVVARR